MLFLRIILLFLSRTLLTFAVCPANVALPTNWIPGIPYASIPGLVAGAAKPQNPTLELQIKNTLQYYPLAIDGKNVSGLSQVFADDIVLNNFTGFGILHGLAVAQDTLHRTLIGLHSQHSYLNQIIAIHPGECSAMAFTYFYAFEFGIGVNPLFGNVTGKTLLVYGQYQDFLVKNDTIDEWRIKLRNVVYMGLPFQGTLSGLLELPDPLFGGLNGSRY